MNLPRLVFAALFAVACSPALHAQDDLFAVPTRSTRPAAARQVRGLEDRVKSLTLRVEPAKVRRGEKATLQVALELVQGFHTYPLKQDDPKTASFVTTLQLVDVKKIGLETVGDWSETPKKVNLKNEEGIGLLTEIEESVTWKQVLKVAAAAVPGDYKVKVRIATQVCDTSCIPLSQVLEAPLTISADPPVAAAEGTEEETSPPPRASANQAGDPAQRAAAEGLWTFLRFAIFFGAISVVTPCVFPMIPITVTFFIKQSEREHHQPLAMALVYSGTIVVVLSVAAITLLAVFQQIMQHWAANFFLGVLFVVFGLSLFGMFEIRLPSGLARFTAEREGQGGFRGTVFMALTFTLISFACVAPFMGSFAGLTAAAQSGYDWLQIILGALAFSMTFAAPFFFLALFPSLLRALPRSGQWMNTVKVVMGFIEIAAAVKFLRGGELLLAGGVAEFLTYDLCIASYVALNLLCGAYLLNLFRMDHDTPSDGVSTVRLVFSIGFLTLGAYLLPALFADAAGERQRPRGVIFSWLDSFLLRDLGEEPPAGGARGTGPAVGERLSWNPDLKQALEQARGQKRLVFVDFTGVG